MRLTDLIERLNRCPLVASVQASDGSPLEDPATLARMAKASASRGVLVLRAQGVENIRAIRAETGLPVIGLIKRRYSGSEVYITPTMREVEELLATDCEAVALDATARVRPKGAKLEDLIRRIHGDGKLAMGDCDAMAAAEHARDCGADLIGTTLSGYTQDSPTPAGPDLDFVRTASNRLGLPVLAEGRFSEPKDAQSALRCGAAGVVVGGALNDPVRQTERFVRSLSPVIGDVGAVDIGGTWLRFAAFSSRWELLSAQKVALPAASDERDAWIRERIRECGVCRLGVASGGTIDPATGTVLQAKAIIPNHVGACFRDLGLPAIALNDGLASAWGHACLPEFAGRRVATLAVGTGVGCGLVDGGELLVGQAGQAAKLNDLRANGEDSFEDLLGGVSWNANPTKEQKRSALQAAVRAVRTVQAMWMPEAIVLCGGVALADWFAVSSEMLGSSGKSDESSDVGWKASWVWPEIVNSPFGADAGLYGAAALALYPPVQFESLLN